MKKVKGEFVPFAENVPQISTYKIFEFEDNLFTKHKPENVIKGRLWGYADKNNLALYNYEIIK